MISPCPPYYSSALSCLLLSDIEKLGCGCHTRAPKPISVSCVCRGAEARISSSLLSDHRGVLSCVISSPVSLTEWFRKEVRYAGHAHLFGKVVTRGKKGRNYIRGSNTCTRAHGAVCEAMSSVRLMCSSMAYTFCVLVECQKRQEYQTTSSSSTVVGEVIKRWLHP